MIEAETFPEDSEAEAEAESDMLGEAVALDQSDEYVSLAQVDVDEARLLAQSELETEADISGESL